MHISLIYINLVVKNIKFKSPLCTTCTNLVKILDICKSFSTNLVNEHGNLL